MNLKLLFNIIRPSESGEWYLYVLLVSQAYIVTRAISTFARERLLFALTRALVTTTHHGVMVGVAKERPMPTTVCDRNSVPEHAQRLITTDRVNFFPAQLLEPRHWIGRLGVKT